MENKALVLPNLKDAERSIIGAILLYPDAIYEVEHLLHPEMFYHEQYAKVYKAARNLAKKSSPVDLTTVLAELIATKELDDVGGAYGLTKMTDGILFESHIESWAKLVRDAYIRREMIKIFMEKAYESYDMHIPTDQIFSAIDKRITELMTIGVDGSVRTTTDVALETISTINELRKNPTDITGIASGFSIDMFTKGWQDTDLIIIAARPSVGKSAFAINLAKNATDRFGKKIPVAYFSLEMSNKQLMMRLLSAESEILSEKISRGRVTDSEMVKLNNVIAKNFSDDRIFFDDGHNSTIENIVAKAKMLKKKHDIGLIIIDYLQLVDTIEKKSSREQEVSFVSRRLKKLAKELSVPVIALSQLSREIEKRSNPVPILADLRECLAVETSMIYYTKGVGENTIYEDELISVNHEWNEAEPKLSFNIPKETNYVYRLTTATGRYIDATAEHKIFNIEGYKPLKDFKIGDNVGLIRNFDNPEGEYLEQGYAIGAILHNHKFSPDGRELLLTLKNADSVRKTRTQLCKYFKKTHRYQHGLLEIGRYNERWKLTDEHGVQNTVQSIFLNMPAIPKYFLSHSNNKGFIEYMKAIIESDRTQVDWSPERVSISFPVVSENHTSQLLYLMARIGIIGKVKGDKIVIDDEFSLNSISEKCRVKNLKWKIINDFCKGSNSYSDDVKFRDIYIDEVESIQYMGEQPVFDRHVYDNHNFVANGIIVHNSGAIEQDADVIIFLYKPSQVEIDNDAEKHNSVYVKIAKHRNGLLGEKELTFKNDIQKFANKETHSFRFSGYRDATESNDDEPF